MRMLLLGLDLCFTSVLSPVDACSLPFSRDVSLIPRANSFLLIGLMLFHPPPLNFTLACPVSKSVSQGWRNWHEAIPAQVWKASGTNLRIWLLAGGTSDSSMERVMSRRPVLVAAICFLLPLTWGCSCSCPVACAHRTRGTSALERPQELAIHCTCYLGGLVLPWWLMVLPCPALCHQRSVATAFQQQKKYPPHPPNFVLGNSCTILTKTLFCLMVGWRGSLTWSRGLVWKISVHITSYR